MPPVPSLNHLAHASNNDEAKEWIFDVMFGVVHMPGCAVCDVYREHRGTNGGIIIAPPTDSATREPIMFKLRNDITKVQAQLASAQDRIDALEAGDRSDMGIEELAHLLKVALNDGNIAVARVQRQSKEIRNLRIDHASTKDKLEKAQEKITKLKKYVRQYEKLTAVQRKLLDLGTEQPNAKERASPTPSSPAARYTSDSDKENDPMLSNDSDGAEFYAESDGNDSDLE